MTICPLILPILPPFYFYLFCQWHPFFHHHNTGIRLSTGLLFQQPITTSGRKPIQQGFRSSDKMTGFDRSRWTVSTRKLDIILAKELINTLDLSGTTIPN